MPEPQTLRCLDGFLRPRIAVVFAGGSGSRVRHIGGRVPKCLLALHPQVTILDLVVTQLIEFGVTTLWVAGGPHNTAACEYISTRWKGLRVRPLFERRQGTWNVLRDHLSELPSCFLVANADTVYLTRPALIGSAIFLPEPASSIGIGVSWESQAGNVVYNNGSVCQYDKSGLTGRISDSGYHLFNARRLQSLGYNYAGMLEDGVLQALTRDPQPAWHSPVHYVDLGTEAALAASRTAINQHFDEISRCESSTAAATALNVLRGCLGRSGRFLQDDGRLRRVPDESGPLWICKGGVPRTRLTDVPLSNVATWWPEEFSISS
jgi:hypothetical protein